MVKFSSYGVDAQKPVPAFHRFASGLDEIFGLTWKDNAFLVTQSCEMTRVSDSNGDQLADRFEPFQMPGGTQTIMSTHLGRSRMLMEISSWRLVCPSPTIRMR